MTTSEQYSSMELFKEHTNQVFLSEFYKFSKSVSIHEKSNNVYSNELFLSEMAASLIASRGLGLQEWLLLQSFKQTVNQCFLSEAEYQAQLSIVTYVAVAFYAEFASNEVRDDMPFFDNDELRRGKDTIWKKYGIKNATLFIDVLQSFGSYLVRNVNITESIKYRILDELTAARSSITFCHIAESLPFNNTVDNILWFHGMKVGTFGGSLSAVGALIAGANENIVSQMRKLGQAIAHCAQIDNDCEFGALNEDLRNKSTNILLCGDKRFNQFRDSTSSFRTNNEFLDGSDELFCLNEVNATEEGINIAERCFFQNFKVAYLVLQSFEDPNENLHSLLNYMNTLFSEKMNFYRSEAFAKGIKRNSSRKVMCY